MQGTSSRRVFRQLLLFAVALGALSYVLYRYAPARTTAVLTATGPILLVMSLTPLCLAAIDGAAMRTMLARLGHVRPLRMLFALRFSLEAVASTAPLGPVAADASLPFIFGRALHVPLVDGIAVVAARKWALLAGHAISVSLAIVLGYELMRGIAIPGIDAPLTLVLIVVTSIVAFGAIAIRAAARATTSPREESLASASSTLFARIRRSIVSAADGARAILAPRDGSATRLALLYTCIWLVEVCDTYVLLRMLGAPVDFADALVVEMVASIAKSAAFVSPGGLGAQDAAYVFALDAVAGAGFSAIAVAYVVVRRSRELFFVLLGFLILAFVPTLRRAAEETAIKEGSMHVPLVATGGM